MERDAPSRFALNLHGHTARDAAVKPYTTGVRFWGVTALGFAFVRTSLRLLSDFSPGHDLVDHHNHGNDQEYVQQATRSERCDETKDPQNEKYYGYGVKHA